MKRNENDKHAVQTRIRFEFKGVNGTFDNQKIIAIIYKIVTIIYSVILVSSKPVDSTGWLGSDPLHDTLVQARRRKIVIGVAKNVWSLRSQ